MQGQSPAGSPAGISPPAPCKQDDAPLYHLITRHMVVHLLALAAFMRCFRRAGDLDRGPHCLPSDGGPNDIDAQQILVWATAHVPASHVDAVLTAVSGGQLEHNGNCHPPAQHSKVPLCILKLHGSQRRTWTVACTGMPHKAQVPGGAPPEGKVEHERVVRVSRQDQQRIDCWPKPHDNCGHQLCKLSP
jgi:hypothetical protein